MAATDRTRLSSLAWALNDDRERMTALLISRGADPIVLEARLGFGTGAVCFALADAAARSGSSRGSRARAFDLSGGLEQRERVPLLSERGQALPSFVYATQAS